MARFLYKTSADGEWLESDADITNVTFDGFAEKSSAVAVILPSKDINGNDVTRITDGAFYECTSMESVTIPNGMTSIGSSAFSGCSGLTSMTIPDGVTSIGVGVFEDCTSLTSVTIGGDVMSIGDDAFVGCSNLANLTFLGKTLEQVQNIEDEEGEKYYPWGITNTSIINVT